EVCWPKLALACASTSTWKATARPSSPTPARWDSKASCRSVRTRLIAPAARPIGSKLGRRIEADDLRHCVSIEGQIETGTDTDLKDSTSRIRYNAIAIRREPALPHGQMYQPRQDSILVKAHCSAREFLSANL